jgi:pilus assembly protein TadC
MRARVAWPLASLCGVACGAVVGGWPGIVVGLLCCAAVGWALRHCESPRARRERIRARAQLPIVADLLSSALRAGAAPDLAATVVGEAIGGPVGDRLVVVSRALRIGMSPSEAWGRLAAVPDGERVCTAATRSAESGVALAVSLERLAGDLRARRAAAAVAAARRAGVLGVLPLGLCFLPAFLLTGVIPVIAAVFGDLFRA